MDPNDPTWQQLKEIFRAEAQERLNSLRQILATLATKPASPDALLQQAKREAHNLKGSAATVGANEASALAQRLEKQIVALMGADVAPSATALAVMRMTCAELARLAGVEFTDTNG